MDGLRGAPDVNAIVVSFESGVAREWQVILSRNAWKRAEDAQACRCTHCWV